MFGMNEFHVSASGAIQGHHGPLVFLQINRPTKTPTDKQTEQKLYATVQSMQS